MKYVINNQQDSLVQSINKNVALVFGSFSDSRGKQEKTDLDEAVIVAQETAAWGYGVALALILTKLFHQVAYHKKVNQRLLITLWSSHKNISSREWGRNMNIK